ncbi:MAG: HAD hydrolase-like protein [Candidatus Rokubacteria bacterium]|nr:HAD hydrolase-like protein [Candidatus Rokubacteria bacterium]
MSLDPRLPLEGGAFEPGCGALAEAIAVAGGTRPLVVGKPFRPIFEQALARLSCRPAEAAMVGDSLGTDIRGGLEAGMVTIWLAPPEASPGPLTPHLRVASFEELLARWEAE